MRLIRFIHNDGRVHTGAREDNRVRDLGAHSPLSALAPDALAAAPLVSFDAQKLEVPLPSVGKILALAGNYHKHVAESGFSGPKGGIWTPQIFWKPSSALLRPGGTVHLRRKNNFLDWEVELAVVIGRQARDVAPEDAMRCVFGYTIFNDLSERKYNAEIENRDKREFDAFFDWLMGKWFDGSAPIGPEIVTADEVPDPAGLRLRLWLNGELMQDSNTKHMIFQIPETIAAITAVLTLEPGDVIAMGTPEGVGFARGRPLRPGDHLRAEIEGLGHLDTYIGEEQ
ncbi:MAG TPA: fumarylacetoacetate hydrolase family protein [Acidobacteriaceae bacterium]|nr:fumarylacetoacetate hydrolase family protein [Acidobacteriaceae bacterium]